MPKRIRTVKDYMTFFSVPGRPVSIREFMEFWYSLSFKEREYYKNADMG